MKQFDIVILTESRFIDPKESNRFINNILLEDELVLNSLEELGLRITRKAWNDKDFDWSSTKYALFRATWDYFDHYDSFFGWLQKAAKQTKFINSSALIKWNIDKHYLLDLNKKGIHIPKTLFIEPGTNSTLENEIRKAKSEMDFKSSDFVLKPCIGGGAYHTYKFHGADCGEYEALFQKLIASQAMMLQEFQKSIVADGEISMMVLNGVFTHAVLKIAKQGDFRVQDDFGGTVHDYQPTKDEIDFALKTVKAIPEFPNYARVDMFRDNEGKLALAELEIFEPELWFRLNPNSAKELAKGIKERLF